MTNTSRLSTGSAIRDLVAAVQDLHQNAGAPSARDLAGRIGRRLISHDTINKAIRGHRVISWPKLQLIITALRGDPERLQPLWERAYQAQRAGEHLGEQPSGQPEPVTPAESQPRQPQLPAQFSGQTWKEVLNNYRHDPEEDLRLLIFALKQLDNPDAAALLIGTDIPRRLAARALTSLPDDRIGLILNALGEEATDELINGLDPMSAEQLQLTRSKRAAFPPPPTPDPNEDQPAGHTRSAVDELASLMATNPLQVNAWYNRR